MTERNSLLPDLPPTLERFTRERYPNDVSARRALQAPWGNMDFRSAYDDRALWRDGARLDAREAARRRAFEYTLDQERAAFARDQPFFPGIGTEGDLRSPYPTLSDADFWVFVRLWGSVADARRMLEKPMPVLGGKTSVQAMARPQIRGLWRRLVRASDPRPSVLQIHYQILNGVYT